MGAVDGNIIAAIIGGGIAMGGGLLAVSWRLGRQTQAIVDLDRRVERLEQRIGGGGRRWYERGDHEPVD